MSHFRNILKNCCMWIRCRAACLVSVVPAVYNDENRVQCPVNETCCEHTAWRTRKFLLCVSRVHSLLKTERSREYSHALLLLPALCRPWAAEGWSQVSAFWLGTTAAAPRAAYRAHSLARSRSRLRTSFSSWTTKRKQSGNCDSQVCLWVTASLGASFVALQLAHQFRLRSVWCDKVLVRRASDVLVLLSMISLHSAMFSLFFWCISS